MCADDNARQRIDLLERQVRALREQATRFDHWHDTMHSAWYMRLWWWLQGFRLLSLGRWYRAPWNAAASKYDDMSA